jgi:glycosyltransferase involved in cell wall biosynthesis
VSSARSWRLASLVAVAARPRALLTVHSGLAPAWIAAHPRVAQVASRYLRVLCASRPIADALRAAGLDEKRLVVAPAFVRARLPIALPPPGLGEIRAAHPVLLAAALGAGTEYGAEVLVDAFAMLHRSIDGAGLLLFGGGARDAALDARLRARGLSGAVHRYGDLGRGAALAAIAAADCFVRPTLADGDAVSVREALALGVRTVASDAAPRPDRAVLFRAGDPGALAAAIRRALAGPRPAPLDDDGAAAVIAAWRDAGVAVALPPPPTTEIAPAALGLVAEAL